MNHGFRHILALCLADDYIPEFAGARAFDAFVNRKRKNISRPIPVPELQIQLVDALFVDQLDRKVAILDADLGKRRQNGRPESGRHILEFQAH